jgi:hypothetical protein
MNARSKLIKNYLRNKLSRVGAAAAYAEAAAAYADAAAASAEPQQLMLMPQQLMLAQ